MNVAELNLFPLWLSIKVAFMATVIGLVVGLPCAWVLSRNSGPFSHFADSFLTLPVVLPPTVLGYYLLVLLGRQSSIGRFLEENFDVTIVFTPVGAVIAATIVSLPFMIKTARTAFAAVDADLIHAARLLGRTDLNIFFAILVPLSWRGIVAGIVLTFARAVGDFGTTLMIAGNIPNKTATMPIAIYDALLSGNRELTDTLVLIMTLAALTSLFLLNRLENRG